MLRLPSTRNMGIVCRTYKNENVKNKDDDADADDDDDHENSTGTGAGGGVRRFCTIMEKLERVKRIAIEEGADGKKWVDRARGLANPSILTSGASAVGAAGGGVGNKGH